MIDISDELRSAYAVADRWSQEAALAVAGRLRPSQDSVVDWDDGAGERWARIVSADRVTAIISMVVPLVILEQNQGATETDEPVQVVRVLSLDEPILMASRELLGYVFGEGDRLEMVDVSRFSANDLWYATV